MKKRVLPLFLCVALLLSMVPGVLAAEIPVDTAGNQTTEAPAADGANLTTEHTPKKPQIERAQETVAMAAAPTSYGSEVQYEPEIRLAWDGEPVTWRVETGEVPERLPVGVSYTRETHTLTLQNAELSGLELSGFGDLPLTVRVSGENTIEVESDRNSEEEYRPPLSISLCNNVTFTGGGTLNVTTLYSGEPSLIQRDNPYNDPVPARNTFTAEDVYSCEEDVTVIYGLENRNSTLLFDNVSINVNSLIQESIVGLSSGNVDVKVGASNAPVEFNFGHVELKNNSSVSISGLGTSSVAGNVLIDTSSSLTTGPLSFIEGYGYTIEVDGLLTINEISD